MESVVNMEQEEQLNVSISNVLAKFQSVSGLNLELKKEQETAVKRMLMDRDVLAVLPTGYGKSLIFHLNLRDGGRATKQRHKSFYPGNFRAYQHNPRSDCRSKVTRNQVCVLAGNYLSRA